MKIKQLVIGLKINKYEPIQILAAFAGAIAGTFLGMFVFAELVFFYLIKFG